MLFEHSTSPPQPLMANTSELSSKQLSTDGAVLNLVLAPSYPIYYCVVNPLIAMKTIVKIRFINL